MIIMLAGPIKHWWDENWGTTEHRKYAEWRSEVSRVLVNAEHLVYRPHEAFKGPWNENAQAVNDMAIRIADVIVNLTPPGVPSVGTDQELIEAARYSRVVIDAPPPLNWSHDVDRCIGQLIRKLKALETAAELHGALQD